MSDKDKKNRKEREDLTRIEDLSEFFHNEDEDFSDLQSHNSEDKTQTDLSNMATDPDMQLPPGFNDEEEEADFSALENNEDEELEEENDDQEDNDSPPSLPIEEDDFSFDSTPLIDTDDELESEDDFSFATDENEFETTEDDFATDDDDYSADPFDTSEATNDEEEIDFDAPFMLEDSEENETEAIEDDDNFLREEVEEESPAKIEDVELPFENEFEDSIEEPIITKTELPKFEEEEPYKSPESFKELQQFSKSMSYGNMAKEGTPPFSIILKDIKYEEDLEDILILLKEFKIIAPEDEEQARKSLTRGNMLIPRLGEFAAITLCHKLRRYDLNILMGLTEEIHPAKSYESDDRGLTTKNNIYNNKKHNWKFENISFSLEDILTSTTQSLENHDILEYISVETETLLIDQHQFSAMENAQTELNSSEIKQLELKDIYHSLLQKLKLQALDKKANGIIGISFQVLPVTIENGLRIESKYQITCSGSLVWINKK